MKNKGWIILGISTAVTATLLYAYRKPIFKGVSRLQNKAISIANSEYSKWNKPNVKYVEGDPQIMPSLRSYWKDGAGVSNWSDAKMITEAWSAAFISYVMKKAGFGDDFKYSASHSVYIRQAVKNRKENNQNPIKGYRPTEIKLKEGYLVCRPRQSGVNYDTTGSYKSHCDIVTDIKGNRAIMVGGNVSQSVTKQEIELDNLGHVIDPKYHVVIKTK